MNIVIGIYDSSRLVAKTPPAEPAEAWSMARAYVRAMAHGDGYITPGEWYRTANRVGYSCGQFRATPILASES